MIKLNKEQIINSAHLFGKITDTTLKSCLEGIMGNVYGDSENPKIAAAILGYVFIGGNYDEKFLSELFDFMEGKTFVIVTENEKIRLAVIKHYRERCKIQHRFETVKKIPNPTYVDYTDSLPDGFTLKRFDEELYNQSICEEWSKDFCENFKSSDEFLKNGLGYGILHNGKLICGVTSFTYYSGGYEIIIATKEEYRKRGFAKIVAYKFIKETLKQGKLPSWDAAHEVSLKLAEDLGFELDYEYIGLKITN